MIQQYGYLFKLILIGNASVGKSSLLSRFYDNSFSQSTLPTIGVDFKIRTIQCGSSVIKLQIWNTAGQQRFRTITVSYIKGAHGIVLAYDISDRKSFRDIQNWLSEVQKYGTPNVVKLLVGIKSDLQSTRQVQFQQAQALSKSLGISFIEASPRNGVNVNEAFITLANQIKYRLQDSNKKGSQNKKSNNENSKPSFFKQFFSSSKKEISVQQKKEQHKNKVVQKEEQRLSQLLNELKIQKEKNQQKSHNYEQKIQNLEEILKKSDKKQEKINEPVKSEVKQENLYQVLTANGVGDIAIQILKSQDIKSLQELKYLKDEDLKQLGIKLGQIARIRKLISKMG